MGRPSREWRSFRVRSNQRASQQWQETGAISAKDRIFALSLILLNQARALLAPKPSAYLEGEGENSVYLHQRDSRSIFSLLRTLLVIITLDLQVTNSPR